MKTISVTESAYQRLSAWKHEGTFSQVIERMVPAKGTIASVLSAADSLPKMADSGFAKLEQSIKKTRKAIPAPWS
jgi:predicted CopG family antitoxin